MTSVGYVSNIRGEWYLNENTKLRNGQKLPASGLVSTKSPGRYDFIQIADLNGKVRKNQSCSQPCSFRLPDAPVRTSYFSTIFSTIMSMIWENPSERYSAHRSRSGDLSEGIVKLNNTKIDLTSLANIEGQIFLKWRKISSDKKSDFGDWSEVFEVKTENRQMIVSFTGNNPGLYEFTVLRKSETSFEPTGMAWVLVSSPKEYEKIKEQFDKVQNAINELMKPSIEVENGVEKEIPGINSESARLYIQAYLDSLQKKKND